MNLACGEGTVRVESCIEIGVIPVYSGLILVQPRVLWIQKQRLDRPTARVFMSAFAQSRLSVFCANILAGVIPVYSGLALWEDCTATILAKRDGSPFSCTMMSIAGKLARSS